MKNETLENIKVINNIGAFSKAIRKDIFSFNLHDYFFWLIGIGLSLLPVIVLSIYPLLDISTPQDYSVIYHILKDVSILFVSISMSISALNYSVSNKHKYSHIYMYLSLLIILFGAMIYAHVKGMQSYNEGVVIAINVIYFTVEFLIGTSVYIRRK